jgi:hypothetical protein
LLITMALHSRDARPEQPTKDIPPRHNSRRGQQPRCQVGSNRLYDLAEARHEALWEAALEQVQGWVFD